MYFEAIHRLYWPDVPNQTKPIDYTLLAELRYQIRRFLRYSEEAARSAGLEPQQHQLLLAVKGMPEERVPTIGVVAERLQLQHHSAVELVDRSVQRGLVRRTRSTTDQRQVIIRLTAKGERILRDLSVHHRDTLKDAGPMLVQVLNAITAMKRESRRQEKAKKAEAVV